MVSIHPLIHKVELNVSSFLPPVHVPKELLATIKIPMELIHPLKDLSMDFMKILPRVPLNLYNRLPLCPMFNMSLKIMMWNVQGAGKQAFLPTLREIIRINNPNVLALVENHISGERAQKICDKIGFSGQTRVEAQGFSGGIWLFWKQDEVSVVPIEHHGQHITVKIARVGDDPWIFSAIYASPDSTIRRDLWSAMENNKNNFSGPWILAGDFNETRNMSERQGVGGFEMQRRCLQFSNWMEDNDLIDLGYSGPAHTWARGESSQTYKSARLDRFISNQDWRLNFEEGVVRHLPKAFSDHCPILLSTCGFAPIPMSLKPFRFQAAWLTHEKFEEFMVKSRLWARLEGIQKVLAERRVDRLIELEKSLKLEMEQVLQQEELLWFQKSRLEAIRDGDRNTKFFHLSTVIRRRRNKIDMLQNSSGE
ncbi:uncharacterized protein LOC110685467 [Chenopodium quinoa]|uniref:uncharacterized protein LOC110685467 n=1 Tax=Chenopodium quinoa TaxID=63459 RepID=UPI000B76FA74|nr:uncharacterized protein LOC110685467 [Chenopodium quinoa]